MGTVLIHCKIRGNLKATLYDLVETNETDTFRLFLQNGCKFLSFKGYPMFARTQRVISNDFYTLQCISQSRCYINIYKKSNRYQPVRRSVKGIESRRVEWLHEVIAKCRVKHDLRALATRTSWYRCNLQ
jgi:hypothetical protein